MRIIAGGLGGRIFESPHGNRTHPMSDKVRGGLFNVLGDIDGLTVLDAFAGSGALSFEAVSRGAASAIAIDADKSAQNAIAANIGSLQLENQVKLVKAAAGAWENTNPEAQFDLVVLDPPYDNLQIELLNKLAAHAKASGIIIISHPPNVGEILPATSYKLISTKSYGDAELSFFRYGDNLAVA